MPLSFEQSKDEIARLAAHFATHRAVFLSDEYKEANARGEFIDALFIALNWDVHNELRAAPDFRQVVVEESLEIEGHKKAPDYAFLVGRRNPKFFAEAKKPGESLKNAPQWSFQLRRYGWSAKLSLSVLTDFEELVVYDCRFRPAEEDKPSVARVNYLKCEEYADRWPEVWDVFSHGAVLDGSFDQFARTVKAKRGTSEVDVEFLKEIERWREALAKNIAIRNPRLTIDELNDAVQRTIDRIVFLRMAEDRGIEEYGRLQHAAAGEGIYARLLALSRQADARYNSGLFDFSAAGDKVTPGLVVDDKALRPILADLYYPQSPYEFSVLPAQILGNVYEQFLGKVIRLTPSHQAKVEEKPEVKKAGGVYYTPAYIVEYIVKHTVGTQVEGKSPKQLKGFRVLDMACGSGSFLLGAYQYLLDHYQQWYAEHDPGKHAKEVWEKGQDWQLTTAEKKRILLEHIYGVDIDRQAVEVTKLSLLLKVLEGESDETLGKQLALFHERALPNLDRNIKCGNSLIGPDYFSGQLLPDAEELRRVNPFDWAAEFPEATGKGGFDCVIGNPPYIRIQTMKEWAPLEVEAYKQLYTAADSGNYDVYVVFVEKGLTLLRTDGRLGFILPHKFFNAHYGESLRDLISRGKHLTAVIHFGSEQVFPGATTYTCLLFLAESGADELRFERVDDLLEWRTTGKATVGMIPADNITAREWSFVVGEGAALNAKLRAFPMKLGDVADAFVGLQTSADDVFIMDLVEERGRTLRLHSKASGTDWVFEKGLLFPIVSGTDVRRYDPLPERQFVLFPYRTGGESVALIDFAELAREYPRTASYLEAHRKRLEGRESGKAKGARWYGYIYLKNMTRQSIRKLCVPRLVDRLHAAYDADGTHFLDNVDVGGITFKPNCDSLGLLYLLGLLNSSLLRWYFPSVSAPFRGGWLSANRQFISQLPICPMNLSDPTDRARHDQMVRLVEQMLDLHRRKAAAADMAGQERLQRLIDAIDKQIDVLVYELYGLTPEEIAVVETLGK